MEILLSRAFLCPLAEHRQLLLTAANMTIHIVQQLGSLCERRIVERRRDGEIQRKGDTVTSEIGEVGALLGSDHTNNNMSHLSYMHSWLLFSLPGRLAVQTFVWKLNTLSRLH